VFLFLCGQPDAVSNGHLDELLYSHVDVPTNGLRKVLLHSLHQQGKSLDHGNDLTEGRGGEGRGGQESQLAMSLCADAGEMQGLPLVCPHDQQTHQERKESVKFSMNR